MNDIDNLLNTEFIPVINPSKNMKVKVLKNRYVNKSMFNPIVNNRFWSKVDIKGEKECWEWNSTLNIYGYGIFIVRKRTIGSHRMSYILTYGEIPEGMCILHRCDNRSCVNPKHLFLGTYQDNTNDMVKKGRQIKIQKIQKTKIINGYTILGFYIEKLIYRIFLEEFHKVKHYPNNNKSDVIIHNLLNINVKCSCLNWSMKKSGNRRDYKSWNFHTNGTVYSEKYFYPSNLNEGVDMFIFIGTDIVDGKLVILKCYSILSSEYIFEYKLRDRTGFKLSYLDYDLKYFEKFEDNSLLERLKELLEEDINKGLIKYDFNFKKDN